ncbi:MAG: hypothetical protein ACM3U2_06820 [Deltaproteobacteria bacterium]
MAVALVVASSAEAAILGSQSLEIDFTKPDEAARKATWSDPDHLTCTERGFGVVAEENACRDGWLQTIPAGIGTSWRPTSAAHLRVTLKPARNREAYDKFREEYRKLDVPWTDDEEAMCGWILEGDDTERASDLCRPPRFSSISPMNNHRRPMNNIHRNATRCPRWSSIVFGRMRGGREGSASGNLRSSARRHNS